ncbi:hypothetical protein H9660_14845, partial [Clostridium sp. Sa3CUN1]|nr:hypothetical protein [Clostridium gallinarum]
MYKLIKELVKKNKISILIIFLLQFISSIISMFTPYLNGSFIDSLISVSVINQLVNFILFIVLLS